MKIKLLGLILIQATLSTLASADVQQGAAKYDWQTCVSSKNEDCSGSCANSEDINCQNNCGQLAVDKCKSEGLSP